MLWLFRGYATHSAFRMTIPKQRTTASSRTSHERLAPLLSLDLGFRALTIVAAYIP